MNRRADIGACLASPFRAFKPRQIPNRDTATGLPGENVFARKKPVPGSEARIRGEQRHGRRPDDSRAPKNLEWLCQIAGVLSGGRRDLPRLGGDLHPLAPAGLWFPDSSVRLLKS